MRIAAPPMALSCTKEARSMKVSEVVSQRTVIEMSGSCFDVSSVTSQIEPPEDAWAVLTRPLPTDPASAERPKDPSSAAPDVRVQQSAIGAPLGRLHILRPV